jgi:predicted ATP-grasp superfamily ATP-dependent carboligase
MTVPSEPRLLVVGASARAAAFSALRAGLRPECADLFADADLRARCPVRRVEPGDYPRNFLDLPALDAPAPWLYTGGLENHPDLIEDLARRRRPLWGNPAAVLRRVRSPWEVAAVLHRAGVPCPRVWRGEAPPPDGRWVVKPLAGAGGSGVRLWAGAARPRPRRPVYWQEFVAGEACAAVSVGDGETAALLGVTRQLVGEGWLNARRFAYCGSVGPQPLDSPARRPFDVLGAALAHGFGLRGLFGVDCVLRDGVPFPVEVNPRYTASVEVHEYATGLSALALHRRVFEAGAAAPPAPGEAAGVVGKAILFARAALRFPERGPWSAWVAPSGGPVVLPAFADIPPAGTVIEAGRAILTLFGRARTADECLAELRQTAADLDRRLFGR